MGCLVAIQLNGHRRPSSPPPAKWSLEATVLFIKFAFRSRKLVETKATGHPTKVMFVYFNKAFDKGPHDRLLLSLGADNRLLC